MFALAHDLGAQQTEPKSGPVMLAHPALHLELPVSLGELWISGEQMAQMLIVFV
jgi:hypothetical protein